MNEQLEKFLAEQAEKEIQATAKKIKRLQPEREAFLLQNGLYRKEYRPEGKEKEGRVKWPHKERDASGAYVYYKEVPLELTEEEWQQIDQACGTEYSALPTEKSGNGVATLLKVLAILEYFGAFILGCVSGDLAFLYWSAGLLAGSLLLGFAEVVKLLHKINLKNNATF